MTETVKAAEGDEVTIDFLGKLDGEPFEGGAAEDTADAVLGRADVACYVAKEDGRHRSHVYLPRAQGDAPELDREAERILGWSADEIIGQSMDITFTSVADRAGTGKKTA